MAIADLDIKTPSTIQTDEITVTSSAADAVRGLLQERSLTDHALRVFVAGGGCSGYQYGMALEGDPRESDFVFEQHGVRVVVDEVSMNYLRGANIDFVNEVMGSGFKIENPNASSSCGCGHSFRTDGEDAPAHEHSAGCNC
ncbi:MAG: iron-sulfur cluster insertion protein ErpA [Chloroflexi bacterium]|nr:iron-sulfur cluster insertion protein ErpA [Chloroflexota bacterium]